MTLLLNAVVSGVILGQNCVRLSDAAFNDLFFFENLFYQKQCKYAMNIGLQKSEVPFKCFQSKKVPFYVFGGRWLQFLE